MTQHHFIYKTTCLPTGKWYVGMHSTNDLDDGYLGSGTHLQRSIKKYGSDAHTREILEHLPDRERLVEREQELVTREMLSDPLCMNLRTGGTGNIPGAKASEETAKRISKGLHAAYASGKRIPHMRDAAIREKNRAAQVVAQNRPEVKLNNSLKHSKPCTIDGMTVYPSLKALVAVFGQGKAGMRHPQFRYV